MSTNLSGKRAFITGAAGGIGRELVGALLEAGCFVDAADIDKHGLDALRNLYDQSKLNTMVLDISSSEACQLAINSTETTDILINNAGASMGLIRENHLDELVSIDELLPETWDHFINTNLSGAWYLTRAVIPRMKKTVGTNHQRYHQLLHHVKANVSPIRPRKSSIRGNVRGPCR